MIPTEFREALKALGMKQNRLAATLGVNPTTVNRWAKGDLPVPQYAVAYLGLARILSLNLGFPGRIVWTAVTPIDGGHQKDM